ncbi:MAG: polysaccharide lyase family 7 protein, partial [Sphaerospermopsis sp. SIO1G2]|nr:polysaccharide lyase family 7 protein [Sphaerospermopsis sp. SIO1G2]
MGYNSDNFDLTNWKITLPVDRDDETDGRAHEILDLVYYEHDDYFFQGADGAMVFRADADGATTKGSTYARTELREMDGDDLASWTLEDGGTMTATLTVDEMPVFSDGDPGRIIIGQIHGQDDELIRLYYQGNEVYFYNEHAVPNDREVRFELANAAGQRPDIPLGEPFSYEITVDNHQLIVHVLHGGERYSSVTEISDWWEDDRFYFKAGLYLGVNDRNGDGEAQVSFYGLDFDHDGTGFDGWSVALNDVRPTDYPVLSDDKTPPPPVQSQDDVDDRRLNGGSGDDSLVGGDIAETLKGRQGDDVVLGNGGDDYLWGNDGDDTLYGGVGVDTIKGGDGRDVFVFTRLDEASDYIKDFRPHDDKIDVREVLQDAVGFKRDTALEDGFIALQQKGDDVELLIDLDGDAGSQQPLYLATLLDIAVGAVSQEAFIVPEDTAIPPVPVLQPPADGAYAEDIYASGDSGDDMLFGDLGDDILKGRRGDDMLFGDAGDDMLWGNDGDDVFIGGAGADTIKGGDGIDVYVYQDMADAGDNIRDFRDGETLDVSELVATFQGAQSLSVSALLEQGYLSYSKIEDKHVH